MLHEIGVELGANLAAKGCPIKVVDGPEPTRPTGHARERIVIEHGEADTYTFAPSQHRNPLPFVRGVAARITIYAQAPSPGAMHWEHTRRAEHVLDLVLCQLRNVCSVRKQQLSLRSGRFVKIDDHEDSPAQGGAVYELLFEVGRGVLETTWTGETRPEAVVGGVGGIVIQGTDEITGPAHPTPETAC